MRESSLVTRFRDIAVKLQSTTALSGLQRIALRPTADAFPTFIALGDQNVSLAMKTGILYDEATIRTIASTTSEKYYEKKSLRLV